MMILALDCSTTVRSAAILDGTRTLAHIVREEAARTFSSVALADQALREAGVRVKDLARVAVGLGPGSYTGIRSSIAVAQGMQLARNVECCGVNSFDVMAESARRRGWRGPLRLAADAQRNELYVADYQLAEDQVTVTRAVHVAPVAGFTVTDARIAGPDVAAWLPGAQPLHPDALALAHLGARIAPSASAEFLDPIYLRETAFVKAPPPREYL
ncbi:MAG TPA: tRNA (adenosine(37)-N6)-threonylcarbamoyltransferase complex dimerization subunit type 1 TsaB [Methylomirabilota bacterium]|nr:tRNA (adenosine(37)-N6)-threonylcarbamoyltransferase complex dimerization subunit type 1 TsaB [Methylomirabilota bacterium]